MKYGMARFFRQEEEELAPFHQRRKALELNARKGGVLSKNCHQVKERGRKKNLSRRNSCLSWGDLD